MSSVTLDVALPARRNRVAWALTRLSRQRVTLAALAALGIILLLGAFGPQLAPHAWDEINLSATNRAPTLDGWYLFGTDHIGRDVLSRTLYGLRTTVEIGGAAAVLATVAGLLLGAAAGFYGGWLDAALMRVVDLVTVYPAIVLTLAAIGLLPNVAGTVIVAATSALGQAILLDATIEFFSYGMPASSRPSLGNPARRRDELRGPRDLRLPHPRLVDVGVPGRAGRPAARLRESRRRRARRGPEPG